MFAWNCFNIIIIGHENQADKIERWRHITRRPTAEKRWVSHEKSVVTLSRINIVESGNGHPLVQVQEVGRYGTFYSPVKTTPYGDGIFSGAQLS